MAITIITQNIYHCEIIFINKMSQFDCCLLHISVNLLIIIKYSNDTINIMMTFPINNAKLDFDSNSVSNSDFDFDSSSDSIIALLI